LKNNGVPDALLNTKIILASRSPRRTEILRTVGWQFEAVAADIDETRRPDEAAVSYVKRLALEKAQTVAARFSNGVVLAADTTVVVDGEILEKPQDAKDARRMLGLLSGHWHEVITGVALLRIGEDRHLIDHETTRVRFAEMSDQEIDWYVMTGEPMDKAGAYAVQGKGALFIEEIQGDYFNVMGLPVRLVYKLAGRI
jgi:septum formation protein